MADFILASASKSRAALLEGAGLKISCMPADLDEDLLKSQGLRENWSVEKTALSLAQAKADLISQKFPDDLIMGADQMMECETVWFDKPASVLQAKDQLKTLRGKTHRLVSSVCIMKNQKCLWHHVETAELDMRDFSDEFLEVYLQNIGEDALTTVGAYRLEDVGVQLFSRIEGDYFTILGLPLLACLSYFRSLNILKN